MDKSIPKKFIEENGNTFRDSVLLKVPNGAVWIADLKRKDGEVWLCDGWKRFAEYFCISPGHLLIFKYKGNSNFKVIIFDKSASEIDYPFDADHIENIDKNINSKDYVKMEIADDVSFLVKEEIRTVDNPIPPKGIEKERRESSLMMASESGALRRAKAFKSRKPFFMVCMTKTYVSARAILPVPRKFARMHLSKGHIGIILQVSSRKTWTVTCVYLPPNCRFYWPSFARDNDLKVGDVCVFEMVNHVKMRFHIHIFRAT